MIPSRVIPAVLGRIEPLGPDNLRKNPVDFDYSRFIAVLGIEYRCEADKDGQNIDHDEKFNECKSCLITRHVDF